MTDHPEIQFCPVCGKQVDPYMGFSNENRASMVVECPEHGPIEVEYEERDMGPGLCMCEEPNIVRTLAKGTPAEKKYCECGGRFREGTTELM